MSQTPKRPRRLRANSSESESLRSEGSSPAGGRGPGRLLNVSDHDSDRGGDEDDDDDEGEDLLETIREDYKTMKELDQYDAEGLDESDVDEISAEARLLAERALEKRDKTERRARGPRGLAEFEDEEAESSGDERAAIRRRRRYEAAADPRESMPEPLPMDLENFNVPLREFLERYEVQYEIERRFGSFLRNFADRDRNVYIEGIREMVANNFQSLRISFKDLASADATMAIWLADAPQQMLKLFNQQARDVTNELFPEYGKVHDEIFVRIDNLPTRDSLRELRCVNLNQLIKGFAFSCVSVLRLA